MAILLLKQILSLALLMACGFLLVKLKLLKGEYGDTVDKLLAVTNGAASSSSSSSASSSSAPDLLGGMLGNVLGGLLGGK